MFLVSVPVKIFNKRLTWAVQKLFQKLTKIGHYHAGISTC